MTPTPQPPTDKFAEARAEHAALASQVEHERNPSVVRPLREDEALAVCPAEPTKAQETPRCDELFKAMEMHSEGGQGHAARVLARQLERELAAHRAKVDELRSVIGATRELSISAMDEVRVAAGAPKSRDDKSQKRAVDYVADLRAEVAGLREDKERLDWLERFLQLGNSSVFTTTTGKPMVDEDFTDDGVWPFPYCIGYQVEGDECGCYRWEELGGGKKRLRQAIDAATAAYASYASTPPTPVTPTTETPTTLAS